MSVKRVVSLCVFDASTHHKQARHVLVATDDLGWNDRDGVRSRPLSCGDHVHGGAVLQSAPSGVFVQPNRKPGERRASVQVQRPSPCARITKPVLIRLDAGEGKV